MVDIEAHLASLFARFSSSLPFTSAFLAPYLPPPPFLIHLQRLESPWRPSIRQSKTVCFLRRSESAISHDIFIPFTINQSQGIIRFWIASSSVPALLIQCAHIIVSSHLPNIPDIKALGFLVLELALGSLTFAQLAWTDALLPVLPRHMNTDLAEFVMACFSETYVADHTVMLVVVKGLDQYYPSMYQRCLRILLNSTRIQSVIYSYESDLFRITRSRLAAD